MGIGQLFAGFTVPAASPVVAVGGAAIDHTPLAVKDWATSTFGTADKTVLLGGVLVVVFLYSMAVGVLAMRRLALGFAGLVIFAGIGLAAALTRPNATGSYAVPTLLGAIAGAIALRWLIGTARRAAGRGRTISPGQVAATGQAAAGRTAGPGWAGRTERTPGGADGLPPGSPGPADHRAGGTAEADDGVRGPADATGSRVPGGADGADDFHWTDDSGWIDSSAGSDGSAGSARDGDAHEGEAHERGTDESDADEDSGLGWMAADGGTPAGPAAGSVAARSGAGGSAAGGTRDSGTREGGSWVRGTESFRAGPPVAGPLSGGQAGRPARRQFLVAAGVTAAAAAIGEVGGRSLATRKNVSLAQQALKLPKAAQPVAPLPRGVNLPVPGISPFITPNGQFYRVDTALLIPQVDPSNWKLRIHGMVAREITITFDELLRRPLIEDYLTLCCVSNPVGGPYVGNAKWLGASLAALIREARPRSGADQLLATSADGFTSGSPLSVILDGRDSLLAVAMNGAALPTAHGFPARLVVPGLYGYVSACKWVVDLEVTTFAAAQAYWVPRGWSQMGPVKTESRIDVPTDGASVKPGKVAVAGVAWAQHKGIEAVEARVDRGPWHQATLAAVPGIDTWQQWVWEWDATSGTHLIEARATDKTGYTQTSAVADVAPNGASGYPATQVTVS
jgi:DMSO/TMAO reductase YedYZ molybdopterin-dependent catalytic subunit